MRDVYKRQHLRISLPSSSRTGIFCRFGSLEERRPVAVMALSLIHICLIIIDMFLTDSFMFRPRHGGGYEKLGVQEIEEKYSITSPLQVIDLLALMRCV